MKAILSCRTKGAYKAFTVNYNRDVYVREHKDFITETQMDLADAIGYFGRDTVRRAISGERVIVDVNAPV